MRVVSRSFQRTPTWAPLACVMLAAASAPGCSAELPEGAFVCDNGGGCPDGWRCLLDDRCYSPTFPGFPIYSRCEADDECASGKCEMPFDTASVGRCSIACTASTDCPNRDGVLDPTGEHGVCSPDMDCIMPCDDLDDCDSGPDVPTARLESCVVVPMTAGETACIGFPDTSFNGDQDCMGPADCQEGLFCLRATTLDVRGVCVWPCSPNGNCPTGATCEPLPTSISNLPMNPGHACLATCTPTPGRCMPLTCDEFPSTDPHCVPAGWL